MWMKVTAFWDAEQQSLAEIVLRFRCANCLHHQGDYRLLMVEVSTSETSFQRWIKGFVGPRHFSSLSPFGDSKRIVGTTV
jgi:hypothetical protein